MAWIQNPWRIAASVVLALALLFAGDWTVYRLRDSRGSALGTVTVEQYVVVSLKSASGSRVEYDYVGTTDVNCTRSIFPQRVEALWTAPCWWRERHRKIWTQAGIPSSFVGARRV